MSIFRKAGSHHTLSSHGDRISTTALTGHRAFEEDLLSDLEYAWSWGMAHTFMEAVAKKFDLQITLRAKYEKGLQGSCRYYDTQTNGERTLSLRPTLRGREAWRTFFHELGHAITPHQKDDHGKAWMDNLVVILNFWKEFSRGLEGDLKTRLIEMVTNYGYWRGRPIGMDEDTDPWNRPWITGEGVAK